MATKKFFEEERQLRGIIAAIESDLANPRAQMQSIQNDLDQIAMLQARIEKTRGRIARLPALLAETKQSLLDLRKKGTPPVSKTLEAYKKLKEQIDALTK